MHRYLPPMPRSSLRTNKHNKRGAILKARQHSQATSTKARRLGGHQRCRPSSYPKRDTKTPMETECCRPLPRSLPETNHLIQRCTCHRLVRQPYCAPTLGCGHHCRRVIPHKQNKNTSTGSSLKKYEHNKSRAFHRKVQQSHQANRTRVRKPGCSQQLRFSLPKTREIKTSRD